MATITFSEESDTDTLAGVIRDLHGWTVKVTRKDGSTVVGEISIESHPEHGKVLRLVPAHDLTLPDVDVIFHDIENVEIL